MLAVAVLAAGAAAVVGFTSEDGSADEIAQLEAELDDTEADRAAQVEELEATVTSLEDDFAALNDVFPIAADDVVGADPAGTWAVTATFTDCTGVEGGADQCRTLNDGELAFDMTIGFEDDQFTVESEELLTATLTRDAGYGYTLEALPSTALVPDFTCVDTTSIPELSMTFRVTSADLNQGNWFALAMGGSLVVTVTPSIPDCETSVLNYSMTAEPVG